MLRSFSPTGQREANVSKSEKSRATHHSSAVCRRHSPVSSSFPATSRLPVRSVSPRMGLRRQSGQRGRAFVLPRMVAALRTRMIGGGCPSPVELTLRRVPRTPLWQLAPEDHKSVPDSGLIIGPELQNGHQIPDAFVCFHRVCYQPLSVLFGVADLCCFKER
jgi:hypothetical protein